MNSRRLKSIIYDSLKRWEQDVQNSLTSTLDIASWAAPLRDSRGNRFLSFLFSYIMQHLFLPPVWRYLCLISLCDSLYSLLIREDGLFNNRPINLILVFSYFRDQQFEFITEISKGQAIHGKLICLKSQRKFTTKSLAKGPGIYSTVEQRRIRFVT